MSQNQQVVIKPSDTFEYYQNGIYWNNFDVVQRRHNLMISGDPDCYWHNHVLARYGAQQNAFILSCGNGWVERDLFAKGFLKRAVGVDIMPNYIDEARREAEAVGLPATYLCVDANQFEAGRMTADVVVNVGAMHHLAYVNRVTATMARIARGGLYIGYDYTGPHRNQYPWPVWSRAVEVNGTLPERFRATLRYPHMATMLTTDPSEAVHPELQLAMLERHFDVLECKGLGGGVAYTLLHNNHRLLAAQAEPEGQAVLSTILDADAELAARVPEANLFTFFVARPKAQPPTAEQLAAWDAEESAREAEAAARGGRYYGTSALELIYDTIYAGGRPA